MPAQLALAAVAAAALLAAPASAQGGTYGMYGMYGDGMMPPNDTCPCPGDEAFLNFGGINVPGALLQRPLPVPDCAKGDPVDPAVGFAVDDVADNMYAARIGVYITLFAETDAGVVLFDAPPSSVALLPAAVASVTDAPITHIVYTHTHVDHIGGAADIIAAAGGDVTIVSSAGIAAKLAARMDARRPVPSVTFDGDSYELDIGGLTIEFTVLMDVHDDEDLLVYLPVQKVLQIVDIVYPGWGPFSGFARTRNIENYVEAHAKILTFDFDVFCGSHLTRLGDRFDVDTNLQFTLSVKAAAEAGLAAVTPDEAGALVGAAGASDSPWAFVYTLQALQAQVCYDAVLAEWGDVLGGVDAFGRSYCSVWLAFLSLDAAP